MRRKGSLPQEIVLLTSLLLAALTSTTFCGCDQDDPMGPPPSDLEDPGDSTSGPEAEVRLADGLLVFDYRADSITTRVFLTESDTVEWDASVLDDWCVVDPAQGTLETDQSTELTLRVDRDGLPTGLFTTRLRIESDGAGTDSAEVTLLHYDEDLTPLDHAPLHAAFDSVHQRLVTASADPDRLNVIDPDTGATDSYDLPEDPIALSVNPSGTSAAVGHRLSVSIVDLDDGGSVEYTVSDFVHDVVLADNGWVYSFSGGGNWPRIGCIELSTGVVWPHVGRLVYTGTNPTLHPSGDFIYGADDALEIYDIRGGVAEYVSSGGGPTGRVWCVADGTRLVGNRGSLFVAAPGDTNDMEYIGHLEVPSSALHAGDVRALGLSFYLNKDLMRLFDPAHLTVTHLIPIPGFFVPRGDTSGHVEPAAAHRAFDLGHEAAVLMLIERLDRGEWALARIPLTPSMQE